jgi:hypothetical protein
MRNSLIPTILVILASSNPALGANSVSLDDFRPVERISINRKRNEVINIDSATQCTELCKQLIRNEIDLCISVQKDMVDQDKNFKMIISSLGGIQTKLSKIREEKSTIIQQIDDEKLKDKQDKRRLGLLYQKQDQLQLELQTELINDLNQRQALFEPLPQYIEPYHLYKSYSTIIKDLETAFSVFLSVKNDQKLESMYLKNLISELASKSRRMERQNTHKKGLLDSYCDAKYMYCEVHITQDFVKTLIDILEMKRLELSDEEAESGKAEFYEREVRKSFLPSNLVDKNAISPKKSNKKKRNARYAKKGGVKQKPNEIPNENKPEIREEANPPVLETAQAPNEGKSVQEPIRRPEVPDVSVPIREQSIIVQEPLSSIQPGELEPLLQKPWLKYSEKSKGRNERTETLQPSDQTLANNLPLKLSDEAVLTAKILLGAGAEFAKMSLPMNQYKSLVCELNEGMVASAKRGDVFLARSFTNHQIVKTVIHRLHGDKSDHIPRNTNHWYLAKTFLENVGITKEFLNYGSNTTH